MERGSDFWVCAWTFQQLTSLRMWAEFDFHLMTSSVAYVPWVYISNYVAIYIARVGCCFVAKCSIVKIDLKRKELHSLRWHLLCNNNKSRSLPSRFKAIRSKCLVKIKSYWKGSFEYKNVPKIPACLWKTETVLAISGKLSRGERISKFKYIENTDKMLVILYCGTWNLLSQSVIWVPFTKLPGSFAII